jgi:hypothetical protein
MFWISTIDSFAVSSTMMDVKHFIYHRHLGNTVSFQDNHS